MMVVHLALAARLVRRRGGAAVIAASGACIALPLFAASAAAQSPGALGSYAQTYLPASYNWAFRDRYPDAERLFNAFDYGHAILYEALYAHAGDTARVERREYDYITRRLLRRPPSLALDESAIAPEYARLAPEALAMFDWAHALHRQLYDIWADDRLPEREKDARVALAIRYYRSRGGLAFSSRPKGMTLMEGQPYSLAFRRGYPKFNGLIWAYHWYQMAVYDALMQPAASRAAALGATRQHFMALADAATVPAPSTMPMAAAVAPRFSERYPEAAIIFDNLHSMHDVVSDILANPLVPRERKRAEILRAAARYRDDVTDVTTVAEWHDMAGMMGVEKMGGRADAQFGAPGAAPAAPK